MKIKHLLGCLLTLMTLPACATQNYVLDDVRLIDGTNNPAHEHMRIVLSENIISAVGPASSLPLPQGADVRNLHGQTVMPGIVSDHVHLAQFNGVQPSPAVYTRENIIAQLTLYAKYGVTTVMSLGVNRPLFYDIRDE